MFNFFIRPALLIAASASLGACSSSDGYGRSVVSVGYSTGGYYPYAARFDRSGYYGWYDGFYYPGTGYYIYDRAGSRHRWNDSHRRYWEARRGGRSVRDNWSGYRDQRYAGRQPDRRVERNWQGQGSRQQRQQSQQWQQRQQQQDQTRRRDDRQQWQGGDRRSEQSGEVRRAPPQAERPQQRAERQQQRAERSNRQVNRGQEFRRGRDRRGKN